MNGLSISRPLSIMMQHGRISVGEEFECCFDDEVVIFEAATISLATAINP